MHKYLIALCFVAYSAVCIQVAAVEVNDLYQASVPVDSQSSKLRREASKKALQAVMLKVGGEQSVLDNEVLKKAVSNYNNYITKYRYHTKQQQLYLLASFNEDKVNALFQQAQLPLWGRLRPQVLLWLIDEQGLAREIMANSSASSLPEVVNDFSSLRGLPLVMPLMDLTDATQVSLSDVWGRFEQPIRTASTRYFAEAIVVMRLSNSSLLLQDDTLAEHTDSTRQDDNSNCGLLCVEQQTEQRYHLDWTLFAQSQRFTSQYQGSDKAALVNQGLADITELIYKHYALSATNSNEFVLEVANVDSLKSYKEIFTFLSELSALNAVTLTSAQGTSMQFRLQLLGSKAAFMASLQLNKQLKQYIDPLAEVDVDAIPVFYWGQQ